MCTGSQGEPMAALSRMANRDHRIEVGEGDTVILASSLIPGNENAVYRVINGLTQLGRQRRAQGQREGARLRPRQRRRAALLLQHRPAEERACRCTASTGTCVANGDAGASRPACRGERDHLAEDGTVVDLERRRRQGRRPARRAASSTSTARASARSPRRDLKDRRILARGGLHLDLRRRRLGDRQGRRRARDPGPRVRRGRRRLRRRHPADRAGARRGRGARASRDTYELQQVVRRVVGKWVSGKLPPPPDDHPGRHRRLGPGRGSATRRAVTPETPGV